MCSVVRAQLIAIPEAEALASPTSARLMSIHAAAQRDGWAPHAAALRAAAFRAYEKEKFSAAEAWLNACHWAALFGQSESDFTKRWIQSVQTMRVGHANMPRSYDSRPQPLAARMKPALQSLVFTDPAKFQQAIVHFAPHQPRDVIRFLTKKSPLSARSCRLSTKSEA